MSLLESNTEALERLMEEVNNIPAPNPNGASVQTDWNQTDETAPDFLKNKTHYTTKRVVLEEQELSFDAENGSLVGMTTSSIWIGDRLIVVLDAETYVCTVSYNIDLQACVFGNEARLGSPIDTGEPFFGAYMDGVVMILTEDTESHIVKIDVEIVRKLDNKYYSGNTVFYTDENYLFIDKDCTTRVAVPDVREAMETGAIVVLNIYGFTMYMPVSINIVSGDYAIIACTAFVNGDTFRTKVFYTAEYVPET